MTDTTKLKAEEIINHIAQRGTENPEGEAEVYRQAIKAMIAVASPAMLSAALSAIGNTLESGQVPVEKDFDMDEACEDIRTLREQLEG